MSWFQTKANDHVKEDVTPEALRKLANGSILFVIVPNAIDAIKEAMTIIAKFGSKSLRIRIDRDYCLFEDRISQCEYISSFGASSSRPSLRN